MVTKAKNTLRELVQSHLEEYFSHTGDVQLLKLGKDIYK